MNRAILWEVQFTTKVDKAKDLLPIKIQDLFYGLVRELENLGPIRKNWKNFSSLSDITFHCHLKKGRPTYVACWRIEDKKKKILEVYYVGTHENAPY